MSDVTLFLLGDHPRDWPTRSKTFKCPACSGIAVRVYGPSCSGTAMAPHEPRRMRTANSSEGVDGDTAGLVVS